MNDKAFEAADLNRLLANLIRVGTVTEVNGDRAIVDFGGGQKSRPLRWPAASAGGDSEWCPMEVGEQVLVLSQGGDLNLGVIAARLHSVKNPAPTQDPTVYEKKFRDGTRLTYDTANQHLEVILPEGGTVGVEGPGGIELVGDTTIQGTLEVQGTIDASDDITSEGNVKDFHTTNAEIRERLDTHPHGGPGSPPTPPPLGGHPSDAP